MRRLLATSIGVTALVVGLAGTAAPAFAGQDVATTLAVRGDVAPVNGQPVVLRVSLTDPSGDPVVGQLLRLVVPVGFMGTTKNEIVGEGTTNERGVAAIRFAPSQPGTTQATVSFWGAQGYAPSDTNVTLEVVRPVVAYDPTPAGLQAPWARAALIPIPFVAVWLTYLFVLWFVVRLRRAGGGTAPSERTAES
jgi:hypothetical protein